MNLKVKATLLWVLALIVSSIVVLMIFATGWLILTYPEICFSVLMGGFILYNLICLWLSVYNYVKIKEKNNGNI